MQASPDPFDEFLRQLAPLMQSPKFPSLKKSPPLYESLEFACVAARHGTEWILISGKTALRTPRCVSEAGLKKVAALNDIIALEGCMPAGEFNDLVVNLRHSWVLKQENVRLTTERARGYTWMPPSIIKLPNPKWISPYGFLKYRKCPDRLLRSSADSLWVRPFALYGNGPNPSSVLSDSTLQKIDSQLRSSTPAFNGFDGLCAKLGLPVQRSNLTSSFQLLAELPAAVDQVGFEKGALHIYIECLGAPDLMVEWLPEHEFQKVHAGWVKPTSTRFVSTHFVSMPVPRYSRAAKLILSFGELQAHVATVAFSIFDIRPTDPPLLDLLEEEPTLPDSATRKAPNQEYGGRKRPIDPDSNLGGRRALVRENSKSSAKAICLLLENSEISLPPGPAWEPYRPYQWVRAYQKDEKLRRYINAIISKDKKA